MPESTLREMLPIGWFRRNVESMETKKASCSSVLLKPDDLLRLHFMDKNPAHPRTALERILGRDWI